MAGALAFLVTFGIVVPGTWVALAWLRHRAILDLPNDRSSHTIPTPRGGGLAVVPAILLVWAVLVATGNAATGSGIVTLAAAGLLLISWQDDRKGLPPLQRFAAHALAVIAGLFALPHDMLILQGWAPLWLDRVVAFFAWAWFLNLTNFMDGIDGITGVEIGSVGVGLAIVAGIGMGHPAPALAMAAGAIAFLYWNWSPARIFLGDSGSVPLGYLTGWLLIEAAAHGAWAAALILPGYYWADATITLARRALRGERVWVAHREHFYQQAIRRGGSHGAVSGRVLLTNAFLVLAATASLAHPWYALAAATVIVALLLWRLAKFPTPP